MGKKGGSIVKKKAVLEQAHIEWLTGDDTGISSETIFWCMFGFKIKRAYPPSDPSDLGRCLRLHMKFPDFIPRIGELAIMYPEWRPFTESWPKMMELWLEESQNESGMAPKLYELMKELEKKSEDL